MQVFRTTKKIAKKYIFQYSVGSLRETYLFYYNAPPSDELTLSTNHTITMAYKRNSKLVGLTRQNMFSFGFGRNKHPFMVYRWMNAVSLTNGVDSADFRRIFASQFTTVAFSFSILKRCCCCSFYARRKKTFVLFSGISYFLRIFYKLTMILLAIFFNIIITNIQKREQFDFPFIFD